MKRVEQVKSKKKNQKHQRLNEMNDITRRRRLRWNKIPRVFYLPICCLKNKKTLSLTWRLIFIFQKSERHMRVNFKMNEISSEFDVNVTMTTEDIKKNVAVFIWCHREENKSFFLPFLSEKKSVKKITQSHTIMKIFSWNIPLKNWNLLSSHIASLLSLSHHTLLWHYYNFYCCHENLL